MPVTDPEVHLPPRAARGAAACVAAAAMGELPNTTVAAAADCPLNNPTACNPATQNHNESIRLRTSNCGQSGLSDSDSVNRHRRLQ